MAVQTGTRYRDPATLEEALSLLADLGPEATVLAGGQDLVRAMNLGDVQPSNIVDISGLDELREINRTDNSIQIGALVTHEALAQSSVITEGCSLLTDAKEMIGGGQQIHNRGTIGGALCAAEPVYDYPACLVALEATLVAESADGSREIPATEFFTGASETALRPEELLTGIVVPELDPAVGTSYEKLKYTEGCYTIASAAALVTVSDGTLTEATLALGGIEDKPRRLTAVESLVAGEQLSSELRKAVSEAASDAVERPRSDAHADGEYRRSMAGVMTKRALSAAVTNSGSTEETQ